MYSPRINEDLVRRLYPLCREVGVPMTKFVNGALERAVICAEAYIAKGEKKGVRDMIGVLPIKEDLCLVEATDK